MPESKGSGLWQLFKGECFEALEQSKNIVKLHGPGFARVIPVGGNLNVQFKGVVYEVKGTDFEKAVNECKTD